MILKQTYRDRKQRFFIARVILAQPDLRHLFRGLLESGYRADDPNRLRFYRASGAFQIFNAGES